MIDAARAFSGFSTDDVEATRTFYADVLGLQVEEDHGMLRLGFPDGHTVLVYPKEEHTPASFTILNFPVADLEATVDDLVRRGVTFIRYDGVDDRGIMRGWGPDIAWFTDPGGNILAVIGDPPEAAPAG